MQIDRRSLIGFAAVGALTPPVGAQTAARGPTPGQMAGPFYPIVRDDESRVDLTRVPGRADAAHGDRIALDGRIVAAGGRPVAGALVLLWQANTNGRYAHPRDTRTGGEDPNFLGHALVRTRGDGSFSVLTVKPGAYPWEGMMRTPHIHFQVIGDRDRLTTQMYFPGEPLNEQDQLLRALEGQGHDPRGVIAEAGAKTDAIQRFSWEIVLASG